MNVTQTLQKWGNSAGVRLPKDVIRATGLEIDDELVITTKGKSVILTPQKKSAVKLNLKELLKGVTPENVHKEVDWGQPVGKEIW